MDRSSKRLCALIGSLALVVPFGQAQAATPGVFSSPGTMTPVSVDVDGGPATYEQGQAHRWDGTGVSAVSDDGRFVAFESDAPDLVDDDTNGTGDIFLRDLLAGTTERLSVSSAGVQGDGQSRDPVMSADGRWVAFRSFAKTLDAGATSGGIYVRDRLTGTTECISKGQIAAGVIMGGSNATMSADGRFVAFKASLKDLKTKYFTYPTVLLDRSTGSIELVPGAPYGYAGISDDGRFLTFTGVGALPAGAPPDVDQAISDSPGYGIADTEVYVLDRLTGLRETASIGTDGDPADGSSMGGWGTSISGDGRFVVFASEASNLVPNDTNGRWDVFVRDRAEATTTRVSLSAEGLDGLGSPVPYEVSADAEAGGASLHLHDGTGGAGPWILFDAQISRDGSTVVFVSDRLFGVGPPQSCADADQRCGSVVLARDLATGSVQVISSRPDGTPSGGEVEFPAVSRDGHHITFISDAPDLASGFAEETDTETGTQLYVVDRGERFGSGPLNVKLRSSRIDVSGWTRISGQVTEAADTTDDAADGADAAGGELTGGRLVNLPEEGIVLASWDLAAVPSSSTGTRVPTPPAGATVDPATRISVGLGTALYSLTYDDGETRYELRASQVPPPPSSASQAAASESALRAAATRPGRLTAILYRCAPSCVQFASLSGSIGTSGNRATVALPLDLVGDQLRGVTFTSAIGTVTQGVVSLLDDLSLGDVPLTAPALALGIAPFDAAAEGVPYDTLVAASVGRFQTALVRPSAPGQYRVWSRACHGTACVYTASSTFTIGS